MKVIKLTKIRFVNVMSKEVVEIKINKKMLNSYTLKDVLNKYEDNEKAVSSPYRWVDELTKKLIFDGFTTTFNFDQHLSRPLNSFLVTSKIVTTLIFPLNPSTGNLSGGVRSWWSRTPPPPATSNPLSPAASNEGEDNKKTYLRSIFVFNGTIDSKIYVRVSYTTGCGCDNFPTKDVVVPAVEICGTGNWEQVRFKN